MCQTTEWLRVARDADIEGRADVAEDMRSEFVEFDHGVSAEATSVQRHYKYWVRTVRRGNDWGWDARAGFREWVVGLTKWSGSTGWNTARSYRDQNLSPVGSLSDIG